MAAFSFSTIHALSSTFARPSFGRSGRQQCLHDVVQFHVCTFKVYALAHLNRRHQYAILLSSPGSFDYRLFFVYEYKTSSLHHRQMSGGTYQDGVKMAYSGMRIEKKGTSFHKSLYSNQRCTSGRKYTVNPTRQNIQQTRTRPDTRTAKTGRPEPDPTVNYLTRTRPDTK